VSRLVELIDALIEAASLETSPAHELGAMAQFVGAVLPTETPAAASEALARLGPALSADHPHAPILFVLAGALIEAGARHPTAADAVAAPLGPALRGAAAHLEALATEPGGITEETWAAAAEDLPPEWETLDWLWRPAVAALGAHDAVRERRRGLFTAARRIADLHPAGYWLAALFAVPTGAGLTIVAEDAGVTLGGRVWGVADLAQLATLLAARLADTALAPWASPPPSPASLACAKGLGPQRTFDVEPARWTFLDAGGDALGPGTPLADLPREGDRLVVRARRDPGEAIEARRAFSTLAARLELEAPEDGTVPG
jgi:hypothetical protein